MALSDFRVGERILCYWDIASISPAYAFTKGTLYPAIVQKLEVGNVVINILMHESIHKKEFAANGFGDGPYKGWSIRKDRCFKINRTVNGIISDFMLHSILPTKQEAEDAVKAV